MSAFVNNMPISRRLSLAFSIIALISIIAIFSVSLISLNAVHAASPSGRAAVLSNDIIISNLIVLFLLLAVIFITAFLINRTITQPLTHLVAVTRHIEKGQTSTRAEVRGYDEIAVVAASINTMLDVIVGQHDMLQSQVVKLVNEVSRVAKGDLSIQAEVIPGSLGMLAEFFNYMIRDLSNMIIVVKQIVDEVQDATTNTQQRMQEQVQTADLHVRKIEAATREVQKMSQASLQVSQSAQQLGQKAEEAQQQAIQGRAHVQETVRGMIGLNTAIKEVAQQVQHLDVRSKQIHNFVEIMSQFAKRTQRLSLDASIQAAMAGDNGKGFKAVADDIRRLSEYAEAEVGKIGQIVRDVREDIDMFTSSMSKTEEETERGTKYVEGTGAGLQRIFDLFEQQAEDIQVINTMVREQRSSSSAAVQIMQEVSLSTEQSNVQIRNVTSNMDLLAKKAARLRASVGVFQLKGRGSMSNRMTSLFS